MYIFNISYKGTESVILGQPAFEQSHQYLRQGQL